MSCNYIEQLSIKVSNDLYKISFSLTLLDITSCQILVIFSCVSGSQDIDESILANIVMAHLGYSVSMVSTKFQTLKGDKK